MAFDTRRIPTEHQPPRRTLVACLVCPAAGRCSHCSHGVHSLASAGTLHTQSLPDREWRSVCTSGGVGHAPGGRHRRICMPRAHRWHSAHTPPRVPSPLPGAFAPNPRPAARRDPRRPPLWASYRHCSPPRKRGRFDRGPRPRIASVRHRPCTIHPRSGGGREPRPD